MSIPQDKLSDTPVPAPYLDPDGTNRAWLEDFEKGPVAIEDTSQGANFQDWHLTYDGTTFFVTPTNTGLPVPVINVVGATQCSLAFDQNARPSIAYMTGPSQGYLYWYSTIDLQYITTQFEQDIYSVMLTLDDKRQLQTAANDILLWVTILGGDSSYSLYALYQRDRYTIPYLMDSNVAPYIAKVGMHEDLRVQISLTTAGP